MQPKRIRVISIGLFRHAGRVLVFEGYDSVKQDLYYRPLGGGVEPGESTADALRREIREELNQEIHNLRLVTVLENLFHVNGRPGHEIIFVYDVDFVDSAVYERESLMVYEDNGDVLPAAWRALDSFDEKHRLVPEALLSLIGALNTGGG